MEPKRINLRRRFGQRYKVQFEESYFAEHGQNARVEDPVLMVIACRFGHIYPNGGDVLAGSIDGHPKMATRMRRLPCCRVHQDGDDGELTVLFNVADFDRVARIMRPRRRRQISETERERLRAMGYKKGHQTHVDVQYTAHTSDAEPRDDSEPVRQQLGLFGG